MRDPAPGLIRRNVSRRAVFAVSIVEVGLSAGGRVSTDRRAAGSRSAALVVKGAIEVTLGKSATSSAPATACHGARSPDHLPQQYGQTAR